MGSFSAFTGMRPCRLAKFMSYCFSCCFRSRFLACKSVSDIFDKSDGIGLCCVGVEGGDGERATGGIDVSGDGPDRSPSSTRGRNVREGHCGAGCRPFEGGGPEESESAPDCALGS